MIKGRPFVKWAGGKRQIIDKLKNKIFVGVAKCIVNVAHKW